MSARRRLALALLLLGGAACTSSDRQPAAHLPTPASASSLVYAAVGASETAGVGTDDPLRDAWPRVLLRSLPPGSTLYDFGVAGSTTEQALHEQADAAAGVGADVVTVWLNVNDLLRGVPSHRYAGQLRDLLRTLRRADATVLVANTPRLDTLPLYRACRAPNGLFTTSIGTVVNCPPNTPIQTPPPAVVRAAVDAYNHRIAAVVRETGAVLVDLHALGNVPIDHPEFVSADGFHPSTMGAAAVAEAFERALAVPVD